MGWAGEVLTSIDVKFHPGNHTSCVDAMTSNDVKLHPGVTVGGDAKPNILGGLTSCRQMTSIHPMSFHPIWPWSWVERPLRSWLHVAQVAFEQATADKEILQQQQMQGVNSCQGYPSVWCSHIFFV